MNEKNNSKKKISNSLKTKKIKDFKFYDIDKASTTFQKIITKYRIKKEKLEKQPKNLMAFIEKARFKAEKLETENEYMIKELKKDIKVEKELIDLFGSRAKKHYNEVNNKKFQSKINKYDFFTPKEIKEIEEEKKNIKKNKNHKQGSLPELTHIIFKGRKTSFSPTIMSKNSSHFFKTYSKEIKSNNSSSISTKFKSFYNSTNIKKSIKYRPYNTFDGKNNYIKVVVENNKTNPNNIVNTKVSFNSRINKLRDTMDNLNKKNMNLNLTQYRNKRNNEFNLSQMAYLDTLVKINNQFIKKEKLFQNHFRNNDYGCGFSKMEFRYLTKKYFK